MSRCGKQAPFLRNHLSKCPSQGDLVTRLPAAAEAAKPMLRQSHLVPISTDLPLLRLPPTSGNREAGSLLDYRHLMHRRCSSSNNNKCNSNELTRRSGTSCNNSSSIITTCNRCISIICLTGITCQHPFYPIIIHTSACMHPNPCHNPIRPLRLLTWI